MVGSLKHLIALVSDHADVYDQISHSSSKSPPPIALLKTCSQLEKHCYCSDLPASLLPWYTSEVWAIQLHGETCPKLLVSETLYRTPKPDHRRANHDRQE